MKFFVFLLLIFISTTVMSQYPVLVSPPDAMTNAPANIRFSWLPMRMATQYQVNISQTPLLDTDSVVATNASVTVYRIDSRYNTKTELFPPTSFLLNGTYYWHVRACNDTYSATVFPPNANWTEWSPTRSFTVQGKIPPTAIAPYNNAKMISATPRIQWSPVKDATSYQLYIYSDATLTTLVYQITTTNVYVDFSTPMYYVGATPVYTYSVTPITTTPTLGPLRLGQTYYWYVNVVNSNALNSIVYNFTTLGGAPVLKTPVNNAGVVSVQPTFLWTPVKGATQYRFILTTNADINFAAPLVTVTVNSATNYTLTAAQKLQIGRTYRWRVQALNSSTPVADLQSRSTTAVFKTY